MNKTLYIRDEDATIWDHARELADEKKLSPIIVDALKKFIAEKEHEAKGYERILISFKDANDNGLPKKKAFYGRWIIPPEESLIASTIDRFLRIMLEKKYFAVAVTSKGNIVIYQWGMAKEGEKTEEQFGVYDSFSSAAADRAVADIARIAFERLGVPVEELDI